VVAVGAAAVGVFTAYLRMAQSMPVNADGAGNARQAWDLLHGNVLLSGWTVSDVSFYTTELPQYALIELFVGLRPEVVHIAAAMTYTLVVLLAAAVAVGRSTGREALVRAGIALAVVAVPATSGYAITLLDPDHTGTAVPILVTWLVVERVRDGRRLSWLVALLLTWAAIGDPLVLFVGTLPLIAVSAIRVYRLRGRRAHSWGGIDAGLLVGGVGSVVLCQLALAIVHALGGFAVHPPIVAISPVDQLDDHLGVAERAMVGNFGAHLPDLPSPVSELSSVLHLVALALVLVAVMVAGWRLLTRPADRIADLLVVGIAVNLVAFVVSTQAGDGGTARQIIVVLPFGAALAARTFGPPLAHVRLAPAVVALVVAALCVPLATQAASANAVPAEASAVSQWLDGRGLTYGIGGYWASHNVTLATGGRVQVAPTTGDDPVLGYRWESRADWYDATRHDARFVIIPLREPADRMMTAVRAEFGDPVEERFFPGFVVLVYDHNVLVGLPAMCVPEFRPRMADCPPTIPGLPGTS
jgi:hypothetical protein